MIKVLRHPACYSAPSQFGGQFRKPLKLALSSTTRLSVPTIDSKLSSTTSFNCFSTKNDNTHQSSSQSFSALSDDTPWDSGNVWSNMAFYMFTLHIPLSFGWLSVVVEILQEPSLNPLTEAMSLLLAQCLELIATLLLLKYTAKPEYEFMNFFKVNELSEERNWLLASAIGFGFLFALVVLTSFLVNGFLEPKDVNSPILKELLVSSNISKAACVLVYCIVTPLLEETVYRGFLLRSLSSSMKWQHAVLISSAIFSAAHFSGENFVQLFIIGCVLGSSYCWTGNLCCSFLIHSFYNAMTLVMTFLS
ncbi:CAAX amino terminal protease [Trema orientale]|uniref:CAAX amino terminal protease n=1 Tax=Trema orientale TaxID=63057 RepID=A0A2P5EQI9_TREOI|nr:CAAX amino terminal protease [Trema orientale]